MHCMVCSGSKFLADSDPSDMDPFGSEIPCMDPDSYLDSTDTLGRSFVEESRHRFLKSSWINSHRIGFLYLEPCTPSWRTGTVSVQYFCDHSCILLQKIVRSTFKGWHNLDPGVKKILIRADPDPKHYTGLCYAHSQFDLGTLLQCSDIGGFFFLRRKYKEAHTLF